MPDYPELEIVNTNTGVIMAMHRHTDTDPHRGKSSDPRYCYAWFRIREGQWRQRHLQGYGPKCPRCGMMFPKADKLEKLYREAEKAGLEVLDTVALDY